MDRQLTLRAIGLCGTGLSQGDALDRLGLEAGDDVDVIEIDGGILVRPSDRDADRAMDAFDAIHRRYPNAFRGLAL